MTPVGAVRVAIDMGIFDFVHRASKEDFTDKELAASAKADPLLVVRILRSLVVSRVFTVTALGTYRAEPVVEDLIHGGCLASFIIMHLCVFLSWNIVFFFTDSSATSTSKSSPNSLAICETRSTGLRNMHMLDPSNTPSAQTSISSTISSSSRPSWTPSTR